MKMTTVYTTYARVFLSNARYLAELIRRYASPIPESRRTGDFAISKFSVLTQQEIDDALINPQSSLHEDIKTYANLLKVQRELLFAEQNIREHIAHIEGGMKQLQQKITRVDRAQQQQIDRILSLLIESNQTLTQIQAKFTAISKQLQTLLEKLTHYAEDHDKIWQDYRSNFLPQIVASLKESGMPLTELEENELLEADSMASVIKRFQTLSLTIPKSIPLEDPDFATYFELKTYLAMQASLNRRMISNPDEEIAKWKY
jgi:hypothetical protein